MLVFIALLEDILFILFVLSGIKPLIYIGVIMHLISIIVAFAVAYRYSKVVYR